MTEEWIGNSARRPWLATRFPDDPLATLLLLQLNSREGLSIPKGSPIRFGLIL